MLESLWVPFLLFGVLPAAVWYGILAAFAVWYERTGARQRERSRSEAVTPTQWFLVKLWFIGVAPLRNTGSTR